LAEKCHTGKNSLRQSLVAECPSCDAKHIDGEHPERHRAGEVKRSYFGCLILFLLLWFAGVALHLPQTQRDLAIQTTKLLDQSQHDGVYDKIVVSFSGQEATLTGAVATEEEKLSLENIVRNQVRLRDDQPGRNPVTAVHNRVEVNPAKAPHRHHTWLLVAIYGMQKRVEGVLKSPSQRHTLLEKLEQSCPSPDPSSRARANQIIVDERAWPAADWDKTLANVPDFSARATEQQNHSLIAISTGDGEWQTFEPSASDAAIAHALAHAGVLERDVTLALNDFRIHQSAHTPKPPPP
jgi:hypothetical protein